MKKEMLFRKENTCDRIEEVVKMLVTPTGAELGIWVKNQRPGNGLGGSCPPRGPNYCTITTVIRELSNYL